MTCWRMLLCLLACTFSHAATLPELAWHLLPAFGIVVDLYILVQSFFIELWAQPWATGKSVVVFDVACAALALVLVLLRKNAVPLLADDRPNKNAS